MQFFGQKTACFLACNNFLIIIAKFLHIFLFRFNIDNNFLIIIAGDSTTYLLLSVYLPHKWKGHWTSVTSSPNFFQKSWDFDTI